MPTAEEVVREVKAMLLDRGDRGGRSVRVDKESVRFEDDWVYVIVIPGENGSAMDLVNVFTEIEREIAKNKHWNVLILPASPDN